MAQIVQNVGVKHRCITLRVKCAIYEYEVAFKKYETIQADKYQKTNEIMYQKD